jgi:hypothetical protein
MTITSSTGDVTIANQTVFTCTSAGGYPDSTYVWYNGSAVVENGSRYDVETPGNFSVTCMAFPTTNSDACSTNQTVSGSAVGWLTQCFFHLRCCILRVNAYFKSCGVI